MRRALSRGRHAAELAWRSCGGDSVPHEAWARHGEGAGTSGRPFEAAARWFRAATGAQQLPAAAEARLESMRQRHEQLCSLLSGEGVADLPHKEQASHSKELGELEALLGTAGRLRALQAEAGELRELAGSGAADAELRELAAQELDEVQRRAPALEREVMRALLPRDEADARDVVLEVRAGTGGEEASLFAADLFRMYARHAAQRGWRFEPLEAAESEETGGYKAASAAISGAGAYGLLKHESGVHRVQRVPATESQGRVHTSAVTVAVLPQADEVEVGVRDDEIRVDTFRASGAGGQHVNTTDSAVRVTHLPTGLTVSIQDERSQHKNRAKALKVLRARLWEQQRAARQAELTAARRQLIGSGDRSERVRTYNFPQGRVTDHRVGVTEHGIEGVLAGERLHVFTEALAERHDAALLAQLDSL